MSKPPVTSPLVWHFFPRHVYEVSTATSQPHIECPWSAHEIRDALWNLGFRYTTEYGDLASDILRSKEYYLMVWCSIFPHGPRSELVYDWAQDHKLGNIQRLRAVPHSQWKFTYDDIGNGLQELHRDLGLGGEPDIDEVVYALALQGRLLPEVEDGIQLQHNPRLKDNTEVDGFAYIDHTRAGVYLVAKDSNVGMMFSTTSEVMTRSEAMSKIPRGALLYTRSHGDETSILQSTYMDSLETGVVGKHPEPRRVSSGKDAIIVAREYTDIMTPTNVYHFAYVNDETGFYYDTHGKRRVNGVFKLIDELNRNYRFYHTLFSAYRIFNREFSCAYIEVYHSFDDLPKKLTEIVQHQPRAVRGHMRSTGTTTALDRWLIFTAKCNEGSLLGVFFNGVVTACIVQNINPVIHAMTEAQLNSFLSKSAMNDRSNFLSVATDCTTSIIYESYTDLAMRSNWVARTASKSEVMFDVLMRTVPDVIDETMQDFADELLAIRPATTGPAILVTRKCDDIYRNTGDLILVYVNEVPDTRTQSLQYTHYHEPLKSFMKNAGSFSSIRAYKSYADASHEYRFLEMIENHPQSMLIRGL